MQILTQPEARTVEVLARLPYFQGLARSELTRIAAGCCQLAARDGEMVVARGDPAECIGIVVSGRFKLVLPLAGGREKVLAFVGRGASFGEAAILAGAPHPASVVAIRDSNLLVIERTALLDELARNPRFCRRVMDSVSRAFIDLVQGTETCHLRSSVDRVVSYLVRHAARSAQAIRELELPARKGEIAANLSMTPETFSRALHDLEREGAIQVRGRHIRLLSQGRFGAALVAVRG
ncbi:MAG: Crp/Fnr family transcriptional regulator [Gallionellaceae bacterium]|nr:Crp/Fnr family transcriptional regulator [Gallionellaceae bacterium]